MKIADINELVGSDMFSVEFKKKDGSLRSFECCGNQHKDFRSKVKGKDGSGAAYNFAEKRLLPVWIEKEFSSNGKAGFRSVNLDTITKVVIGEKTYEVMNGEIEEV